MEEFKAKNFGSCLVADDYLVMKAMGLKVNTQADWQDMQVTGDKKQQVLLPLKSIERQFARVLSNSNKVEIEQQLYPLLFTASKGDGTVLLQNYLGDFGLEKLLSGSNVQSNVVTSSIVPSSNSGASVESALVEAAKTSNSVVTATESVLVKPIPAEGLIVTARQLAQVISGLLFNEFSCGRLLPDQQGHLMSNDGIVLFTTKSGSSRPKGGAIEFEFSGGKINRIAFQLPTYKDFEQSIIDHPVMGDCRIDPVLLNQLH